MLLAKPHHVEFFTYGAFVSSSVPNIYLAKGINYYEIGGLASDFNLNEATFHLAPNSSIIFAQVRVDSISYKSDSEYKKLDKALRGAKDSLQGIRFSERKLAALKSILERNSTIEVSDKSIYVDDLDELLVFYRNKLRVLNNESRVINRHKKLIIHQIDSLKKAKTERITTLGYPRTYVSLQISTEIESNRSLEIYYNTDLASWKPYYSLTVADENAQLKMDAQIEQNFGFDIFNVTLGLSFGAQTINKSSSNYPNTNISVSGKFDLKNNEKLNLASVLTENVVQNHYYFNNPTNNFLASEVINFKNLSGSYYPKGFMSLITSSGNQVVDSFQSSLFNDSFFYTLPLSNDIFCFKTLSKEKLRKALIGNKETTNVEWNLRVENNTSKVQTLVIQDFLPSNSNNSSIEIELNLPKEAQKRNAYFLYKIELEPGEIKNITYGFQISAPKGTQITNYYEN